MELPKDKVDGSSHPSVAFDLTGMVFAVMAQQASAGVGDGGHYIHLYDARNFSGGAFSEMSISNASLLEAIGTHQLQPPPSTSNTNTNTLSLNKIDFNGSGSRMLVQSEEGYAFVLDGYEGTVQRVFAPSSNGNTSSSATAAKVVSCFTQDDQSVLLGSSDNSGTMDCYDIQSGTLVQQLQVQGDTGGIRAIACNPKYNQIASSGTNTWYVVLVLCVQYQNLYPTPATSQMMALSRAISLLFPSLLCCTTSLWLW